MSITTASPSRSGRRDGPRPCAVERPGPCSGVSVGPGTAPLSPGQHLAVEELAVDAAEADRALVAVQPHVVAELAQDVALEAARDEQLRRVLHRRLASARRRARMRVDLPRALARARRPQGRHAVDELGAGQELAVAQVGRGGQHVELEAEPQSLGQADRRQRRGQRAQRRERLDAAQRALGARALEVAAHEQQRLALGRHDQVRVLRACR